MAEVRLEGVHKSYPSGFHAVRGIDLLIRDRELMVLVGPSGCGKSTTLRMVAGLESISAGNLLIDGKRVNGMPPKDRDIAMVFQAYALYPHMTVEANLGFALKMRNLPRAEIQKKVLDAAEILDLKPLLGRYPKELSGGQKQRVAVGRAIVRQPKVFLLDEPLSNLDAKLRVQMRAELSKLHHRLQVTMIYVTHDQVEAMTLGDRITVMNGGVIQQVDTPKNLYQHPANRFVAGFIGSPPMNFLPARAAARDQGLVLCGEDSSFELGLPERLAGALAAPGPGPSGRSLVLGIRPEDLVVRQEGAGAAGRTSRARVEVVEPVGGEAYVHLTLAGKSLVARMMEGYDALTIGEEVNLEFGMERAHLFDPESEQALAV